MANPERPQAPTSATSIEKRLTDRVESQDEDIASQADAILARLEAMSHPGTDEFISDDHNSEPHPQDTPRSAAEDVRTEAAEPNEQSEEDEAGIEVEESASAYDEIRDAQPRLIEEMNNNPELRELYVAADTFASLEERLKDRTRRLSRSDRDDILAAKKSVAKIFYELSAKYQKSSNSSLDGESLAWGRFRGNKFDLVDAAITETEAKDKDPALAELQELANKVHHVRFNMKRENLKKLPFREAGEFMKLIDELTRKGKAYEAAHQDDPAYDPEVLERIEQSTIPFDINPYNNRPQDTTPETAEALPTNGESTVDVVSVDEDELVKNIAENPQAHFIDDLLDNIMEVRNKVNASSTPELIQELADLEQDYTDRLTSYGKLTAEEGYDGSVFAYFNNRYKNLPLVDIQDTPKSPEPKSDSQEKFRDKPITAQLESLAARLATLKKEEALDPSNDELVAKVNTAVEEYNKLLEEYVRSDSYDPQVAEALEQTITGEQSSGASNVDSDRPQGPQPTGEKFRDKPITTQLEMLATAFAVLNGKMRAPGANTDELQSAYDEVIDKYGKLFDEYYESSEYDPQVGENLERIMRGELSSRVRQNGNPEEPQVGRGRQIINNLTAINPEKAEKRRRLFGRKTDAEGNPKARVENPKDWKPSLFEWTDNIREETPRLVRYMRDKFTVLRESLNSPDARKETVVKERARAMGAAANLYDSLIRGFSWQTSKDGNKTLRDQERARQAAAEAKAREDAIAAAAKSEP